ncbi:F0F1 ATP synthase subunit gamma [Prevotella sp. KH2C16]|uniref:F0F1 ATP synthase subunit gamma n=1 Tax=Prevotella sp. KH2C16 TaxID=1855325 RepID=UPI0008ED1DD4|nr:F0F1 ATP synthase subunit gamma [Prevotella sp. KH2C16]SFF97818.1 F-type H+-transporting ATPase subunit gamma [Prevotella sp. KH2C16]
MASLKEIKTRIASVNSTRKITSAMKMVASSKLHHAQVAIQNMLPYENLLEHILKSFLASTPEAQTIFEESHKEIRRVALVVYSSNSSLCGGFNSNILKMMEQAIHEYQEKGITELIVYPIGRKVAEKIAKLQIPSGGDFLELAEKPNAHECAEISKKLTEAYARGEIDKVELIYHHFKSAGSQVLTRRQFLPIDLSTESIGAMNDRDLTSNIATAKAQEYLRKKAEKKQRQQEVTVPLNDNFIVEPDLATVMESLVPKLLNLMIYTALLDSNASEHAARMVAMQTATDNADDLLRDLSLQYNKSRQAAITSELLDIIGGTVNN